MEVPKPQHQASLQKLCGVMVFIVLDGFFLRWNHRAPATFSGHEYCSYHHLDWEFYVVISNKKKEVCVILFCIPREKGNLVLFVASIFA